LFKLLLLDSFVVTMAVGNAIEVKADNVTIDFMHYSIDN